MTSTPPLSVSSMAHELLDRWEHFLQTERTTFSIPDLNPDSPLFGTMADLDLLSRDSIAWAIEQGVVRELQQACLEAVEQRDWTLPMLVRLNLLFAEEILDYPLHLDRNTDVRWELAVIPATGRREDLHRFTGPEASEALNAMGLAPAQGTAVLLGVSTPDDLLAFLSEPEQVMAWRELCENAPGQLPTPEGLPLLSLDGFQDDESHFGAFVYVVGLVERYDPEVGPEHSLVGRQDFETTEARWSELIDAWEPRLSASLAMAEPDEVWDGCVYALTGALVQTFYLQHAIGGAPLAEDQHPAFAIVANAETETFRAVGVFPDGEVISVPLNEDIVLFLPALLECPDFEFDLVDENEFRDWVRSVTGEEEPAPVKPRRLS